MCNPKETKTNDNKTPDQLRADMIKKMQEQGAVPQHLCEVATPGVIRNVKPEDIEH